MGIRKIMAITMATCLTAGALTGCDEKMEGKIIKIDVLEPTTRESRGGGFQEVLGIYYANKTHPTVKISGEDCKVELVKVDNKSDKTETANAAQKLVSEKVSVALGSYGFGVFIAAGQILAGAKISAIGYSYTSPQVTESNDHYFRACFIDPLQGTVTANYTFQDGAKSTAVTTQLGDDYFSELGSFFKDAFTKLGGDIVSEEQFRTNQIDFKTIPTNIKAANPDIIFAPSSITTASLIIRQAREPGIITTIATGDTWENSTIIENTDKDSEGVMLSTFFDEAGPANDEASPFIKGFKGYLAESKQEDIIPTVSALGYGSYLAAIRVIRAAGSTNISAIRDALRGVQIDGITGSITFDEMGDVNKDIVFIKTIKDGELQFPTAIAVE